MLDLNSNLFYKAKLQIQTQKDDQDLLWNLVLKIRAWMTDKWKRNDEPIPEDYPTWSRWKTGSHFSSLNDVVHFKSVYHRSAEELEFWSCKIIEYWPSQNGCAPREWTTEIGYQEEQKNQASVSIVITYTDRPGFIGPCEPAPDASIPNLFRRLLNDPSLICTVDGHSFELKPIHLVPGKFPEFWDVVCDPAREVPVVYISPGLDEEEGLVVNFLDPSRLTQILGPNALVYYATELDFSREMTQLCNPPDLGCYSGAVRVYAPHLDVNNPEESYRHRLLTTWKMDQFGEDVYQILRRALAQDVHFYDKMFRIEDCKRLKDRADAERRKQEYREKLEEELLTEAVEQEDAHKKKIEALVEENFQLELNLDTYEEELRELKGKLHSAEAEADAYREAARVSREREEALDRVRKVEKYPETAEEIASYFLSHFPERIDFTERGWASLSDCHTNPEVLWDAFYQMVTTLYPLYQQDVAQVDREFAARSKLRMARGEGRMTRRDNKLLRQYDDTYHGKPISIEPHIKTSETKESSPRFLRVYFCYDEESRKIVIGSCGKHLDNYTSQKIK